MAIYRTIHKSFWSDRKILDDFTPEDKFFYLYLLTNPATNICGCYEISERQVSFDTGYNIDTVKRLIERMQNYHDVIRFDDATGELLILNWWKYNWTKSPKLINSVKQVCGHIKNKSFRKYVSDCINKLTDTELGSVTETVTETDVSIGYQYPINTVSKECDINSEVDVNCLDKEKNKNKKKKNNKEYFADASLNSAFLDFIEMRKKMKAPLTDRAVELAISKINKISNGDNSAAVEIINQSIENGWKSFYPLKEEKKKQTKFSNFNERDYDYTDMERRLLTGG